MNYIYDSQVVNNIAQKILEPKRLHYCEDQIHSALAYLDMITHHDATTPNRYNQLLKLSLFTHHNQTPSVCLLFLHGFGSNRIESISILPYLPPQYAMCAFDFSAEGKSQGTIVTYGEKEKHDIHAVLEYLRTLGYSQFVLWGRSMGASCALNYSLTYKPHDVFLQVLDSPFCSFSQIALQIAQKRVNVPVPEALLSLGLQMIKKNCEKEEHSPFLLDFNRELFCSIPTIFLYNLNDDVICYKNTEKIIQNFRGHYEKFHIDEKHNSIRTGKTLKTIMGLIKKYLIKKEKNKKQDISKVSKEKMKILFKRVNSPKKGIKLVDSIKNVHDHYGIWVTSKELRLEQTKREPIYLAKSRVGGKRPQSIEVVSAQIIRNSVYGTPINKNRMTQSIGILQLASKMKEKKNDLYIC